MSGVCGEMTKLERLRKQYGVPARRGARVSVYSVWAKSVLSGSIVGATTAGFLRVHLNGSPQNEEIFANPLDVKFLD